MLKIKIIYPVAFALLLISAWEVLPTLLHIQSYVFPTFSVVVKATFSSDSEWFSYILTTGLEALSGFLIGSGIGFGVGVAMAQSKRIAMVALPYVIASNAIPVIAIAPIIILWFGNGLSSKVVVSAFLCFFPLAINTFKGLSTYPASYRELFRVYGASEWSFLTKFKLANAKPFILTGLKLSATFSVIGSIVAEIIASDSGLGYGMVQAVYSLNMPRVWGYVCLACLLGLFAYSIIFLIETTTNKSKQIVS